MKSFAPKRDSHAMAPETVKTINESNSKVTVIGRAYFEAMAKQRARLDAKHGNHEIEDRSIPDIYKPYYHQAYLDQWKIVVDELSKDENGQKICNS